MNIQGVPTSTVSTSMNSGGGQHLKNELNSSVTYFRKCAKFLWRNDQKGISHNGMIIGKRPPGDAFNF